MIRNYLVPSAFKSRASVRPTRKTGEKPFFRKRPGFAYTPKLPKWEAHILEHTSLMWKYQWTQLGSENMHCQLFAFRFHRCWKLWRCLTEVSTVPNQEERRGILKVLPVQTLLYFHSQSTTESIKLQTGYKCGKKAIAFPVEQASHEQASHTSCRSFSDQ